MKYTLLAALVFASVTASAANETNYGLSEALQNGHASLDLSVGYFDLGFCDPGNDNAEALTSVCIA